MNNPSKAAVVAKVREGAYADLARAVFGKDVFDDSDAGFGKLMQALAAYEGTEIFHPFASTFDAVLRGKARFSPLEAKGFALFKDPKKGNCLACHVGEPKSRDPKDWLFTDFTYDTLGAPRNAAIPANAKADYFDLGLCRREGLADFRAQGFRRRERLRRLQGSDPAQRRADGALSAQRRLGQFARRRGLLRDARHQSRALVSQRRGWKHSQVQ